MLLLNAGSDYNLIIKRIVFWLPSTLLLSRLCIGQHLRIPLPQPNSKLTSTDKIESHSKRKKRKNFKKFKKKKKKKQERTFKILSPIYFLPPLQGMQVA